jgi:hypothetical protein
MPGTAQRVGVGYMMVTLMIIMIQNEIAGMISHVPDKLIVITFLADPQYLPRKLLINNAIIAEGFLIQLLILHGIQRDCKFY